MLPVATDSHRPRLCKNVDTVLKSALLRKIRPDICVGTRFFVLVLTVKPALKRFHTAWTQSGREIITKLALGDVVGDVTV